MNTRGNATYNEPAKQQSKPRDGRDGYARSNQTQSLCHSISLYLDNNISGPATFPSDSLWDEQQVERSFERRARLLTQIHSTSIFAQSYFINLDTQSNWGLSLEH